MGMLEGFVYGAFGGVLAEFLRWFDLREKLAESCPKFARSWVYWLLTLGMVVIGGILVVVYMHSGVSFNSFLALNIGASAPLILSRMSRHAPDVNIGPID